MALKWGNTKIGSGFRKLGRYFSPQAYTLIRNDEISYLVADRETGKPVGIAYVKNGSLESYQPF